MKLLFCLVLVIGAVSFFSTIFLTPVFAQAPDKVPFYCIGGCKTGETPTPTPAPTAATRVVNGKECADHPHDFWTDFMLFFGFLSKPRCPETIAKATPKPTAAQKPTEKPIAAIQLVSRKVAKVEGKDMSITVAKPDSMQSGDIILAMIGSDYAHVKSHPSGWNQIRQDVKNEGHEDDLAMQSYYKVVTSKEEENYTWKLTTKRKDTPSKKQPLVAVDMYVFRGVDQNSPIVSNAAHGETSDPQAIECPSVKGIKGGMLVCAYLGDDPGSIKMPSTMTQTSNFEVGGGDTYAIGYEKLNSDSETGKRTAVWNNSEKGKKKGELKNGSDFAHAIVLRPK